MHCACCGLNIRFYLAQMSPILRAHIALFVVNLIYGANYIIAKGVMPDYVDPSGFILMRVTGAVLLFWIVKSFIKEKVARKDLGRLVLCGLFGVCLNQLLFFEGLNLTSPINASIIMTFNPIMVLILAALIIKEKITLQKVVGILIGTSGAIFLILNSAGTDQTASVTGDIFILINAFSYALYLVLVKPLMSKYKPTTVISYVFLFGTLFVYLSPFAISDAAAVNWSEIPTGIWWSITYVVICTTFLAYLLNIFALKNVSPSVASGYIYLQPIMAGFFAWLFSLWGSGNTEEYVNSITLQKVLFTIMIFLGVFLVSRPIKWFERKQA